MFDEGSIMAVKQPKSNRYFRIQNRVTGLYSKGGNSAYWLPWTKKGKIWTGIGYVKAYLSSAAKVGSIDNLEVVEYELVEVKRSPAIDNIDILKILKT